ncbi:MAG TPA: alpha/beta hydrolase [Acidimicrobiia bacterium]|nr:alpha/beta hydrolase [Acidimicrobiia bacterium]
MPATVVLVHGAWHGAWCWDRVLEGLEARGIRAEAIDLPGHGRSAEPLGDLYGDAAALRRTLDGLDGPVVVCGHSYGGAVVSEGAAAHPAVRHVVYLAALMLDVGESASHSVPEPPGGAPGGASEVGPAMRVSDDGRTVTVDHGAARRVFYADCSDGDVDRALAHLDAHPTVAFEQPATAAAWRGVPSTYVVCSEDRAIAVWIQQTFAQRATDSVVWATSHSPFLSRPDLLVDLLADLAGE